MWHTWAVTYGSAGVYKSPLPAGGLWSCLGKGGQGEAELCTLDLLLSVAFAAVALAALVWKQHWPLPSTGCKVESIFLNVAAVNTHRDRPQVALSSLLGWWTCSLGVS